jgi:hypothetical protein
MITLMAATIETFSICFSFSVNLGFSIGLGKTATAAATATTSKSAIGTEAKAEGTVAATPTETIPTKVASTTMFRICFSFSVNLSFSVGLSETATAATTTTSESAIGTEAKAKWTIATTSTETVPTKVASTTMFRICLSVHLGQSLVDLIDFFEALWNRLASISPILDNEVLNPKTQVFLLLFAESRKLFGELFPFKLKPDERRQHLFFDCLCSRRLRRGKVLRLSHVNSLGCERKTGK